MKHIPGAASASKRSQTHDHAAAYMTHKQLTMDRATEWCCTNRTTDAGIQWSHITSTIMEPS